MSTAWHSAAFQRSKKMPELAKVLTKKIPVPKRGKGKPWEKQFAAWSKFAARK